MNDGARESNAQNRHAEIVRLLKEAKPLSFRDQCAKDFMAAAITGYKDVYLSGEVIDTVWALADRMDSERLKRGGGK